MPTLSGKPPGFKHGESTKTFRTRLHRIWGGIIQRCHNPRNPSYSAYGGRGITVCQEWRESFITFRDWARANGYADNLEIDRIDNSLGYSPENCRFVTHRENARNTRLNKIVTAWGESKSMAEWLDDPRHGTLSRGAITYRLNNGWTPEEAFSTGRVQPNIPHTWLLTAWGETKDAAAWTRDPRCQVKTTTFHGRIKSGWSVEDALTVPPGTSSNRRFSSKQDPTRTALTQLLRLTKRVR